MTTVNSVSGPLDTSDLGFTSCTSTSSSTRPA